MGHHKEKKLRKEEKPSHLRAWTLGFVALMMVISIAWFSSSPYPQITVADLNYPSYDHQFVQVTGLVATQPTYIDFQHAPYLIPNVANAFPTVNSSLYIRFVYLQYTGTPASYMIVFMTQGQYQVFLDYFQNLVNNHAVPVNGYGKMIVTGTVQYSGTYPFITAYSITGI